MLEYFCRLRRARAATAALTVALTIASLLLSAPPTHAQLVNGFISGTLTDPMNAAVPGADVILTSKETGIPRTIKSDQEGFYRFVAVKPGIYDVSFKKTGFQSLTIENIILTTSEERTFNQKLNVAGLSQSLDVHEFSGTTISRTSATVAMVLSGLTLDLTPMGTSSLVPAGARNYGRYALFAPTVVRVPGQNEFATNGHPGRDNNFMVDGGDNNDNTVTLPALLPPPEAIQEFQIQVTTFSAEFGRNMGAQVNAVTTSGTNDFHGEAWEFYRGSSLEPLSLQSRKAGLTQSPRLVDNQFGFDIGGPIIRKKTFFFGLIQGNRQRQAPKPAGAVTIPTAAGYSSLASLPLRLPSGSVVAQSSASRQSMLDALNFLPSVYPTIQRYDTISSVTVNSTPVEFGTYNPLVPQDQNLWYGVTRLDHQATQNDHISYRFHIDNRETPLSGGNLAFGERWGVDSKTHIQNHALSYTKTMGDSFVNEARVTYARLSPSFAERDPVSPTITISGLFTIGGLSGFPQERQEQTYQLQNISTYIHNRHSLKFGIDMAWTHLFNNNAPNSKGTWQFANFQDFMNNQANQLTQLVSPATVYEFTQLKQAYFFQDDFKLTRSFTANFGVRYETTSVPLGYFGATDTTVQASTVPGPGQRDKNNWAPRVGFAYSPSSAGLLGKLLGNGKSSIRGGFGMAYDVLFYNLLSSPAANYPRTNTQTTVAANLVDTFPTLAPKTSTVTFSPLGMFANLPANSQNPTSNYWSLSYQRQLATDSVLEFGYVGNRSYHLIRQGQANPGILTQAKADAVIAGCTSAILVSCQDPAGFPTSPGRLDPAVGIRTLLETTGTGSYNAGYVQWTNRTSFGLRYGANYTWSSTITDSEEAFNDIGSSDGGIAGSSPQVPQNYFDRRAEKAKSVFDRPQRFTIHETYTIPFFSSASKFLQLAFANWQISSITEVQSGQPFTITVGVDTLGSGTATPGRPNFNPGGILIPDPTTGNLRTFTTALDGTGIVSAPHVTDPVTGKITFLKNSMPTGGTLGRNSLRGPGYSNTNLSLLKNFKLPKDMNVEIRGDFLNLFNHDNFPNPDGNMSHTTFGKQVFVPLTDARQVLVGAKLRF